MCTVQFSARTSPPASAYASRAYRCPPGAAPWVVTGVAVDPDALRRAVTSTPPFTGATVPARSSWNTIGGTLPARPLSRPTAWRRTRSALPPPRRGQTAAVDGDRGVQVGIGRGHDRPIAPPRTVARRTPGRDRPHARSSPRAICPRGSPILRRRSAGHRVGTTSSNRRCSPHVTAPGRRPGRCERAPASGAADRLRVAQSSPSVPRRPREIATPSVNRGGMSHLAAWPAPCSVAFPGLSLFVAGAPLRRPVVAVCRSERCGKIAFTAPGGIGRWLPARRWRHGQQ
jgi:hypothetical protein